MSTLAIPELSLVLLVGASGAGKSTFAARHFKRTEVLSSDACRGLISDDENDQTATSDAFEVLHYIAAKRLSAGRMTVVDATNVQPEARKPLVDLARRHHCLPVAIVFDLPERVCLDRNATRPDRNFASHVVRRQVDQLRRSLRGLQREGFRQVHVLRSPEEVDAAVIERTPLYANRRNERGPFDIIGDVHGCYDELVALLHRLGYTVGRDDGARHAAHHPENRRVVFLGDLVDRGPAIPAVMRLVMDLVEQGVAICVPGNHEQKLLRHLRGRDVKLTHGLAETVAQLGEEAPTFRERVSAFIDGMVSHYVLDDGRLVVAHAGMKAEMQGRGSGAVRSFAMYGETTGETDEFGLPVRYDWAADYRGRAMVVYGHTPVHEPSWVNNTINIDTGCVFGGSLSALRYPEREVVSVPAARTYYEPTRPLPGAPAVAVGDRPASVSAQDVLGKRVVTTQSGRSVVIREEQSAAAFEVLARFAVDPRWLIYLPPTMSPCETASIPGLLEHPAEAISYYRKQGVATVVCQEKHMGSRAVMVLLRSPDVADRRFGITSSGFGACYTRTGRPFFDEAGLESAVLSRLSRAFERSGLWDELATDWACLDTEIMPWSLKAQELLRQIYAPVGAAALAATGGAVEALIPTAADSSEARDLLAYWQDRAARVAGFSDVYARYTWAIASAADIRVAPFHLLASEGKVYADRDHRWHLEQLARLCAVDDGLLQRTQSIEVEVDDAASCDQVVTWWESLTTGGGEGMVVKPLAFAPRGPKGPAQPAIKCRGADYLRLIYGPEYTAPRHLERLRSRHLGVKRSLALREFALGVEALDRFVNRAPLSRVHECVAAILALESEPVDPRL